ncbi:pyridoxamine 5'-phosphate oxidase family protein [Parendozoicomonas haliclonae]|uniref:Pyridoxamine 5'-phosphate oxidase n=1 Tax=Parendozoicomonas haliclonae TaxID=1960125 RepID=A0A1X7AI20_9GAMM|nr:pyridoxamine 5'-phosphate oxidase family protein [Parendozoicomonas haliclonae]SMA37834.1 Pyridoxamine 5'-phosphate oxidase [Parendozoicomonas haliclonae]
MTDTTPDITAPELSTECFVPTDRSRVRRGAKRASYNKVDVFRLIDDLKLGHMAFNDPTSQSPVIIPMTFWRVGEHLYFHTLNKSRLDKLITSGAEVCISFAEASEWVLSKSAFNSSVNYRSAVLFCSGERIDDAKEFDKVFKAIFEDIEPGRWEHIRPPSHTERKATALLKLTIHEASYKRRTGGPNEEEADMALPVWNGTKPIGCPFHRR